MKIRNRSKLYYYIRKYLEISMLEIQLTVFCHCQFPLPLAKLAGTAHLAEFLCLLILVIMGIKQPLDTPCLGR